MTRQVTLKQAEEIVKRYRKGTMCQEEIDMLERCNQKSIDAIVNEIEKGLERKSHDINGMTITDLRKWARHRMRISDEEKKLYAESSRCTYEEFEQWALDRLEEHERIQKAKAEAGAKHVETTIKMIEDGIVSIEDGAMIVSGDNFLEFARRTGLMR